MQKNLKIKIILSLIFAALNTAAALAITALVTVKGYTVFSRLILYFVLTVVYTVSGFFIRNKTEIGEFKILFTQFGGFFSIAVLLIILAVFLGGWSGWLFMAVFLAMVIPSLILSFIIRLTAKLIKKS